MPELDDSFDVIVVGAGPVGMTAAQRAVRNGLTAAVVERRLAGGECQHYGCIPSKALLWPMELAAEVRRMPGLELRGPIDPGPVLARRDDFVEHQGDAPEVRAIQHMPATFVRGQGRLAGERRVEVDPQVCAAGRTEAKARADGFSVRTVEYDMARVDGAALQADGYTGRVKAVVDEASRALLGFTLVGPAVVDHLYAATIAVTAQVPLEQLWHAVPAVPTVSEFWLRLLEEYGL